MNANTPIDLQALQGIWNRLYLKTSDAHDTTTIVLWMQAGSTHVDLRLTEAFQGLPAKSLYDQDDNALMEIAELTAFAGRTHIDNAICTWFRHINFQGPQVHPDVGELSWCDETLIERGVHENYEEGWQSHKTGSVQEVCLSNDSGQLVFLCTVADYFAIARAHPRNMQVSSSLVERVSDALATHDEASLSRLFDQEFCFGKVEQGYAVVQASSMPSRVGTRVCRLEGELAEQSCIDFIQQDFFGQSDVHSYFVLP